MQNALRRKYCQKQNNCSHHQIEREGGGIGKGEGVRRGSWAGKGRKKERMKREDKISYDEKVRSVDVSVEE